LRAVTVRRRLCVRTPQASQPEPPFPSCLPLHEVRGNDTGSRVAVHKPPFPPTTAAPSWEAVGGRGCTATCRQNQQLSTPSWALPLPHPCTPPETIHGLQGGGEMGSTHSGDVSGRGGAKFLLQKHFYISSSNSAVLQHPWHW
jgi:hypothetical protein